MTESAAEGQASWQALHGPAGMGTGNWKHFPPEQLPRLFRAAETWRECLAQVEKPWLCWCVDDRWCYVQQQLVASVGWTPIVGTDGRVARPRLLPGARFIDFNEQLQMSVMWMHFPVGFMHLFCDKLAFWHSDVLIPVGELRTAAEQFDSIAAGETIAVDLTHVTLGAALRRYLKGRPPFFRRYFEALACTTAQASHDQYESGTGWWRHPALHPRFRGDVVRRRPHFDHGVGIWLWKRYFGGRVRPVAIDIEPHHYSSNNKHYRRQRDAQGRLLGSKLSEMTQSFDLEKIVGTLGLE